MTLLGLAWQYYLPKDIISQRFSSSVVCIYAPMSVVQVSVSAPCMHFDEILLSESFVTFRCLDQATDVGSLSAIHGLYATVDNMSSIKTPYRVWFSHGLYGRYNKLLAAQWTLFASGAAALSQDGVAFILHVASSLQAYK